MNYITIVPIVTMNNGQMQRTQSVLMQRAMALMQNAARFALMRSSRFGAGITPRERPNFISAKRAALARQGRALH